jgi:CheY-like chemotaxis protein
MRRLVTSALERQGYEVEEVGSGDDLFQHLRSERLPDLVVTDLRMPWMDGLEAFERGTEPRGWVPTVLMTAFPSPEVSLRAERAGVEVVAKPFEVGDLVSAAKRALDIGDVWHDPDHDGYEPIHRR